jgi:hypothetical protein
VNDESAPEGAPETATAAQGPPGNDRARPREDGPGIDEAASDVKTSVTDAYGVIDVVEMLERIANALEGIEDSVQRIAGSLEAGHMMQYGSYR